MSTGFLSEILVWGSLIWKITVKLIPDHRQDLLNILTMKRFKLPVCQNTAETSRNILTQTWVTTIQYRNLYDAKLFTLTGDTMK